MKVEEKTQISIKKTLELKEGTLSVEICAENVPKSMDDSSYQLFLDTLIERAKEEFKIL